MKGIRDILYWFVTNFGPCFPPTEANPQPRLRNSLALDISFGSIGYALILARPFVTVSVLGVSLIGNSLIGVQSRHIALGNSYRYSMCLTVISPIII